jgi:predicted transcriptional regulator
MPPQLQTLLKEMKDRGFTQSEIAVAIGVSQATVSAMRNGKVIAPKWAVVQRLLAFYAASSFSGAKASDGLISDR